MNMKLTTSGRIIENSAVVLLARILGTDGQPITRAAVSSIVLKCFDRAGDGTLIVPASGGGGYTGTDLPKDPAILVTPVTSATDPRWVDDVDGYNFSATLDGSYFPSGDSKYQVEVKIFPTVGNPFYGAIFILETLNVYSE
jgi:hypothetical protein